MTEAYRDAGMEVVYLGYRQTIGQIVASAIQEDVDAIGLSIVTGSPINLSAKIQKELEGRSITIPVIVGGVIPKEEISVLEQMGIAGVFPSGTLMKDIVKFTKDLLSGESLSA